jgi:hypothetical protein
MLATAIAAVAVWRTRKPLVGLAVAAWLALGPFAMPWTVDNLSQPQHAGVFTLTIVQLVANAAALIVGVTAQIIYKRHIKHHIRHEIEATEEGADNGIRQE